MSKKSIQMKGYKVLYTLILLASLTLGQSQATANECPPPAISDQNTLYYSTWAHNCFESLKDNSDTKKITQLRDLSYSLHMHMKKHDNRDVLINGAAALSWVLNKQGHLGDDDGMELNNMRIYQTLKQADANAYERAKVLILLAHYWRKLDKDEYLTPLLKELLASIPKIPLVAPDHDHPQRYVLNAILSIQKSAKMHDWHNQTQDKFKSLLN
ncbi:exported hypothetical protein [Candidatus Terasakiella magnetica]|uniref:Uncharacterized protein n=1 Tax=Candidatus Terasakiella magnetica TaxID=1867952 RepID=A0A1C3RJY6_9PROT|nr:hypothetical protein [Candidatus Terasakiella magnetica]SCA57547.1 exported hypothetical protein [Candidatus Terasakiella magnetica]